MHIQARNTYYELTFGNNRYNLDEDPVRFILSPFCSLFLMIIFQLAVSIREAENLKAQLKATQETLEQRDV